MDELFSKAVGAFETLENKAVNAIETTLYEYKPSGVGEDGGLGGTDFGGTSELIFPPSAVSAAKRVLEFWEELDLESKKSAWEEGGVQIAQNQEMSTKNRRTLADQTRAFKSDVDKKDAAPLLKAYQLEIDSLTKRAKFAETSYLQVYKMLYDAPDVVPSLKVLFEVSSRVAQAEQEARRFRQELEVVRKEAANVKTLQAAVRRLEERNAELEEGLEEKVEQIVQLKQKDTEKRLEAMFDRERAQKLQLEEAQASLAALQRLHEKAQSEIFLIQARTDEERAAKQYELDMVVEEIERAQDRARTLDNVRADMAMELEALRAGAGGGPAAAVAGGPTTDQSLSELEANLASKEKLISKLHEQMQQLEHTLAAEREEHVRSRLRFQEALDAQEKACEALRLEIAQRPTMSQLEELRKQAQVLQALIGTDVDEEWDRAGPQEDEEGTARVMAALKDANRRLMAEVTTAKISLSERTKELGEAQERTRQLESQMQDMRSLVSQLEEDILKGSSKLQPSDSWKKDGGSSAEVMSGLLEQPQRSMSFLRGPGAAEDDKAGPPRTSDEGTLLEIVCGQRERFRARVKELEEEQGKLLEALGRSNADAQRLKNEGVELYEKIKYLELYNKQNATTVRRVGGPSNGDVVVFGGSGMNSKNNRYMCFGVADPMAMEPPPPPLPAGAGAGAEMRYRKMYEERMNPFNEFHQREQERSYRNLRLHDKITLTSGRFFLSNKYGRTFIFFYSILLHILIFFVLYRSSNCKKNISGSGPAHGGSAAGITASSTHTFADTVAERVGELIEKTRGLTNSGGEA